MGFQSLASKVPEWLILRVSFDFRLAHPREAAGRHLPLGGQRRSPRATGGGLGADQPEHEPGGRNVDNLRTHVRF
jgi:hypothetical protein